MYVAILMAQLNHTAIGSRFIYGIDQPQRFESVIAAAQWLTVLLYGTYKFLPLLMPRLVCATEFGGLLLKRFSESPLT